MSEPISLFTGLGVFGWPEVLENSVLAGLLTGDPVLFIGPPGSAKTQLAVTIAEALDRKAVVYDASKSLFEDVLGFLNIESLKQGSVQYLPSTVTVWDKEMVLLDEINRALPELQAKWLELIRSRKIMGFPTAVKWIWAAMNPFSSEISTAVALDGALVGRFAWFISVPEILDMDETDRQKVISHINGDDAPALMEWRTVDNTFDAKTISLSDKLDAGDRIREILGRAAVKFRDLQGTLTDLPVFLGKLAVLVESETHGRIRLDGRRLGFLFRNVLALRSVELAKAEIADTGCRPFVDSVRDAVIGGFPSALSEDSTEKETDRHIFDTCFELLSVFFSGTDSMAEVDRIYRLFTSRDCMERLKLLLAGDFSEAVSTHGWKTIVDSRLPEAIATALLWHATTHPGSVDDSMLEQLCSQASELRHGHMLLSVSGLGINALPTLLSRVPSANPYLQAVRCVNLHRLLKEVKDPTPEQVEQSVAESDEQFYAALEAFETAEQKG